MRRGRHGRAPRSREHLAQQSDRLALDDPGDLRRKRCRLPVSPVRDGWLVAAVWVFVRRGHIAQAALTVAGEDRHGSRRLATDGRADGPEDLARGSRRSRSHRCGRPRSRHRWPWHDRRWPPGRASSPATRCGTGPGSSWPVSRHARRAPPGRPVAHRARAPGRRRAAARARAARRSGGRSAGPESAGPPQVVGDTAISASPIPSRIGRSARPTEPRPRRRARPRGARRSPNTSAASRAASSSRNASRGKASPAAPCRNTVTAPGRSRLLRARSQGTDEVRASAGTSGPMTTGWQANETSVAMPSGTRGAPSSPSTRIATTESSRTPSRFQPRIVRPSAVRSRRFTASPGA